MTKLVASFGPKSYGDTQITDTYWGYVVRCKNCDRTIDSVLQWGAGIIGGFLVLASVGLWALPGSLLGPELASFKLALISVLGVFGVTLIWFASNGTKYEIQVDVDGGEIREAVRNSKGVPHIQSRIPFDKIDAVYIDTPRKSRGTAHLVVHLAETDQVIELARDLEENLTDLHTKVRDDLLGGAKPKQAAKPRKIIL